MFEGIFWYATWVEVILVGSTDIKFPGMAARRRELDDKLFLIRFALNSSLMFGEIGRIGYAKLVNYYTSNLLVNLIFGFQRIASSSLSLSLSFSRRKC